MRIARQFLAWMLAVGIGIAVWWIAQDVDCIGVRGEQGTVCGE